MTPYFTRLKFAFRTFFSILDRDRIPEDVLAALHPQAAPASPAAEFAAPAAEAVTDRAESVGAAQMLAILQRDGRLVDFLMEDVSPYPDAQIGAAVRDLHAACRQALQRYLTLAPVIDREEGATVTVEAGIDAAEVKVTGNVAGRPPFQGVLRHRGWRATRVDLPVVPAGGRFVIAPAEVEVP